MIPLGVFLLFVGICSGGRIVKRDTEVAAGSDDTLIGYLDNYDCPPGGGGIFPWPICDKYVLCGPGQPTALMQCKYDYLFDLRYNGCNYPELTDCGNRTLPGGSTQPPTTTTTVGSGGNTPSFVCPLPDGSFRNPYDCGSFYMCNAGKPTLIVCQNGLVYNPTLEVCDYTYNVDCSAISTIPVNSSTTTAATQGPTQTPVATTTTRTTTRATTEALTQSSTSRPEFPQFTCPAEYGNFGNPYDCASFYYCSNYNPTLVVCKSGLFYNPALEICDKPEAVNCDAISPIPNETSTVTTTTPSPINTTAPSFVCPEDGFFSNPANCASFYYCSNGVATAVDCKEGLLFNPDIGICDRPENVNCNRTATASTTSSVPSLTTRTTTVEPTTTRPTTTTTRPTTTTTTAPSFSCNGLNDGIYANPDDCGSFYQCSGGQLSKQSCASGLTFNPDKQTCDFPYNFYPPCGTRFRCPAPEGHFAHPTDCSSFYVCSYGESHQQYCNPPLVFNSVVSVCDFTYNVSPPCGTCSTC